MSVPANPAAPAARQRPGSVTVSSYLLYLVAILLVVIGIAALATIGVTSEVLREAYAGTEVEGAETFAVGVIVVSAVVQFLFAAGFVVLALLNNRGNNVTRIITWVLAGLALCCTGLGLAGNAFSGMGTGAGSGANLPDPQDIQRRLTDEMPSWVEPVSNVCSVLALLALLAAIILLALPASNEFFRKPQPGWEPPVPGAAYPGYPQATAGGEPGYPSAPGYPSGPDQPGQGGHPPAPGNPAGPGNPPGEQGNPPNNPPSAG
ncbi:hypothetical protein [Plantactinospora sp. CA-290183]|uniref:hypothetical protein n=1 Tax=Plantactinospora sp. CA-290183 TaxID=3240006 RepID=UPI003D92EF1E